MHIWTTEELVRASRDGREEMDIKQLAKDFGICPFDLFRQAYGAWFQDGPNDEVVGHYLEAYVEEGALPHWVELYAEALVNNGGRFVPAPMQAVA